MKYFQCNLEQGTSRTTAFIEARGAKVGAEVEIPDLGGFWKVTKVGHGMTKEELNRKQVADRNQRKASDI